MDTVAPARVQRVLTAALGALGTMLLLAACTSGSSTGGRTAEPSGTPAAPGSASAPTSRPAGASTTPGSTRRTVAHTPVAPPTAGNIHSTVPSRAVVTRSPVALRSTASFGRGVTVHPQAIKAIRAKAHGPGEISGPAIEVVLRFHNAGSRRADLRSAVVTVTGANGDPANTIAGPPADPVRGHLAPGASAIGRYVFTLATDQRHPVTVTVATTAAAPVVQFVGNAD